MSFAGLSSLLRKSITSRGLSYQVEASMALQFFDQAAEELWQGKMKDRARAMYLKDHALTIAVLSPVLSQEIRLKEAQVLEYINKKAGAEIVTKLKFIS